MTTTTATEPTTETPDIPGEVFTATCDAVRLLDSHCDDPRGLRSLLDELASSVYHSTDDLPSGPLRGDLQHLGNNLWQLVDFLDHVRDEADRLHAQLLDTLP